MIVYISFIHNKYYAKTAHMTLLNCGNKITLHIYYEIFYF